jgi:hypothetical protein
MIQTEEMLTKNLAALKLKRKQADDEENKNIAVAIVSAPFLKKEDIKKQLAFIDKYNIIKNEVNFVLLTKSEEVKVAYNRMIRNDIKTIG